MLGSPVSRLVRKDYKRMVDDHITQPPGRHQVDGCAFVSKVGSFDFRTVQNCLELMMEKFVQKTLNTYMLSRHFALGRRAGTVFWL